MASGTAYVFPFTADRGRFLRNSRRLLVVCKLILIAGLIIFRPPYAWLAVAVLFASMLLEIRAARVVPRASFTSTEVVLHGVFSKRYSWQQIHHIILKDGLLTIDLVNNRIVQQEVSGNCNEAAFNAWCAERLSAEKR